MLFSERKLEVSRKNSEHIQRATFSIVLSVLGVQPNSAKLYRIMNTPLVGVYSEYLVESRYLAGINTQPFHIHLKRPILIYVVRVIQCRYILIQNTFITEASYKKFLDALASLDSKLSVGE